MVCCQYQAEEDLTEMYKRSLPFFFVSFNDCIQNKPQILGELSIDLECELETLAISMAAFPGNIDKNL